MADETRTGANVHEDAWVSPNVLAAQNGKQVEFGSTITVEPAPKN